MYIWSSNLINGFYLHQTKLDDDVDGGEATFCIGVYFYRYVERFNHASNVAIEARRTANSL